MTLDEIKSQWNLVLDDLLTKDRIAWLAFFDARLVSLEEGTLRISFADVHKLGGEHDFSLARNPRHTALLLSSIESVLGLHMDVIEE